MAKAVLGTRRAMAHRSYLGSSLRAGNTGRSYPDHGAGNFTRFTRVEKTAASLDSLSFGSDDNAIRHHVQQGMSAWVDELAKVAREGGVSPKKARQKAQDAISQIQGTLVVARVMKDYGPFERMLSDLPTTLLGKQS